MQPDLGFRRRDFGMFLYAKYVPEPFLELEKYGKYYWTKQPD